MVQFAVGLFIGLAIGVAVSAWIDYRNGSKENTRG